MRTSIEFLKAEAEYQGAIFLVEHARCNVCNTPVTNAHEYKTTDPNYLRDFIACEDCHKKVQGIEL